jgi:hypothetical protein
MSHPSQIFLSTLRNPRLRQAYRENNFFQKQPAAVEVVFPVHPQGAIDPIGTKILLEMNVKSLADS